MKINPQNDILPKERAVHIQYIYTSLEKLKRLKQILLF